MPFFVAVAGIVATVCGLAQAPRAEWRDLSRPQVAVQFAQRVSLLALQTGMNVLLRRRTAAQRIGISASFHSGPEGRQLAVQVKGVDVSSRDLMELVQKNNLSIVNRAEHVCPPTRSLHSTPGHNGRQFDERAT